MRERTQFSLVFYILELLDWLTDAEGSRAKVEPKQIKTELILRLSKSHSFPVKTFRSPNRWSASLVVNHLSTWYLSAFSTLS